MIADAPISWLVFYTLAAAVIVAAEFFLNVLSSRQNKAIVATAIHGEPRSCGIEPAGAAAELGRPLAVAPMAIALLALGYHSDAGSPVVQSTSTPNNRHLIFPKPYQPDDPRPDTRAAPTGSSSGSASESGGHAETTPKL